MITRSMGVRTVNDEDLRVTLINVGNVKEVDVVLSEGHHGLVGIVEASRLDVVPGSAILSSSLVTHVQGE